MTIKQFKSAFDDPVMADFALDVIDVWSNDAVKGYLLIACRVYGMPAEQIEDLMICLLAALVTSTVDDAISYYRNSDAF